MFRALYKKYWEVGYKTRLYDSLTPESYKNSLNKCIQKFFLFNDMVLLDAGCGTGQAIESLADFLKSGGRYLGTDILETGLIQARKKINQIEFQKQVIFFRSNLMQGLALKNNSIDGILFHFSLYLLSPLENRIKVLKEAHRILKPAARMVVVNPSNNYNPINIIENSIVLAKNRYGIGKFIFKKLILYPLALYLGLRHIQEQLRNQSLKAYNRDDMRTELEQAGFKVMEEESTYADSAYLMVGEKDCV